MFSLNYLQTNDEKIQNFLVHNTKETKQYGQYGEPVKY
jgi:hypothetical protein